MLKQTIQNGEIPMAEWEKLIVAMAGSDRGVFSTGGGSALGIERKKLVSAVIEPDAYFELLTPQHQHVVDVPPEEMFTLRKLPPGQKASVVNFGDGQWWLKRKNGWGHVLQPREELKDFTPRFREARWVSIGGGEPSIGRKTVSAENVDWCDFGTKIHTRHYGLRTEVTVHIDGTIRLYHNGPQVEIGVPDDVVDYVNRVECMVPDLVLDVTRDDGGDGGGEGAYDAFLDGDGFVVTRAFADGRKRLQEQSNTFRVRADFSYITIDWDAVERYIDSNL